MEESSHQTTAYPPQPHTLSVKTSQTLIKSHSTSVKCLQQDFVRDPSGAPVLDSNQAPITVHRILATKPLRCELQSRPGPGNRQLTYMSGDSVTRTLNEVFGFDGWSLEVKNTNREECIQDEKKRYHVAYTATVRVTHNRSGVFKEDCGAGDAIDRSLGTAVANSLKASVTDAMKRASRHFGEKLGNSLYQTGFSLKKAPGTLNQALKFLEEDRGRKGFPKSKYAPLSLENGNAVKVLPPSENMGTVQMLPNAEFKNANVRNDHHQIAPKNNFKNETTGPIPTSSEIQIPASAAIKAGYNNNLQGNTAMKSRLSLPLPTTSTLHHSSIRPMQDERQQYSPNTRQNQNLQPEPQTNKSVGPIVHSTKMQVSAFSGIKESNGNNLNDTVIKLRTSLPVSATSTPQCSSTEFMQNQQHPSTKFGINANNQNQQLLPKAHVNCKDGSPILRSSEMQVSARVGESYVNNLKNITVKPNVPLPVSMSSAPQGSSTDSMQNQYLRHNPNPKFGISPSVTTQEKQQMIGISRFSVGNNKTPILGDITNIDFDYELERPYTSRGKRSLGSESKGGLKKTRNPYN